MSFILTTLTEPLVLIAMQATIIFLVAILFGLAFRKSAAVRNCVLTTAMVFSFIAPFVLAICIRLELQLDMTVPVYSTMAVANSNDASSGVEDNSKPLFQSDAVVPTESSFEETVEAGVRHRGSLNPGQWSDLGDESLLSDEANIIDFGPIAGGAVNTANPARDPGTVASIKTVLLLIWVFGSLFFAAGTLVSVLRTRRLLRDVQPIDRRRYAIAIKTAAKNIGLSEFPKTGVSRQIDSPVAVGGVRNAQVLLPNRLLANVTTDQLIHVLTHEGAHIARRDPAFRLWQRINIALWWWHPLVYVFHRHLGRAREEICDNFVINKADAGDYGATLLELGKLVSQKPQLANSLNLFGSRWKLEHRIEGLLNPRRKTMTKSNRLVVAMVATLFAGLTVFTSSVTIEAQETADLTELERRDLAKREKIEIEKRDREKRDERDREKRDQQRDHVKAAIKHLEKAGWDDLSKIVAQRAGQIEHEFMERNGHNERNEMERRERQRREDTEHRLHELRDRLEEGNLSVEIRQQIRDDIGALERAGNERRRSGELRSNVQQERRQHVRTHSEHFQTEVMGAIRELNEAVKQLRNEVNELRERDR